MAARYLIWPRLVAALFLVVAVLGPSARAQSTSLASWNDGPARRAIVDFVRITTDKASPSYVPPADRIATFDQDGTLWTEQPLFTQVMFALDRARALAPNGFRTYMVNGGGQEFMRVYAERVYDIPPEQIIGSSIVMQYEMKSGQSVLMRLPKVFFIDDHDGKAVGINLFIGKRPYTAFGNSDGGS